MLNLPYFYLAPKLVPIFFDANLPAFFQVALEVARTAARARAKLIAMQTNALSFLFDPADLPSFRAFVADFDLDAMQPSVRGACEESRAVAEFRAQLVPDQVDERTFWARYFFRMCELRQEEQKRQELFSTHLYVSAHERLDCNV